MKSIKIFGFYTLLLALFAVGLAAGLSRASSDSTLLADAGATVPTRTPHSGATVPTRTPNSGGTIPTRTPDSGTIPTRTPNSGGTIPTRTPDSGGTIPTRTPETASADQGGNYTSGSNSNGSMIILQSSSADGDDWVVVEWLAGDGNWYQVDGWRGHISNGQLMWWVANENLGQGPFRWVVYANDSEAEQLQTSEPFSLPASQNETKTFSLNW